MKRTELMQVLLIAGALLAGCKRDEDETPVPSPPPPANEEELITTVVLTFTDTENAADVYELRYTDLDGPGGADPVLNAVPLPAGRSYALAVRFLNETESPAEEITTEVANEGAEHQVFFQVNGAPLTISYSDTDVNGRPIGLANMAITGAPGTGSLTVTLRHEPQKDAAGVSAGDITNAGGETDVETTPAFTVVVQ